MNQGNIYYPQPQYQQQPQMMSNESYQEVRNFQQPRQVYQQENMRRVPVGRPINGSIDS